VRGELARVAAAALLALAAPLGAQDVSAPSEPAPRGTSPGGVEPLPLVWTLSLGVGETYESNALSGYVVAPDASLGDFVTQFQATLARQFPRKRSRLGLSAQGGGSVYRENSNLTRFTYALTGIGGYDITRRLSVDATLASTLGYVRDLAGFDPSLTTLAPYTLTNHQSGLLNVNYKLVPDTSIELVVRGERYAFDDDTSLTDGKSIVAVASLLHSVTAGSTVAASAEYERTSFGPTFEVQRLLGRWEKDIAKGWRGKFDAGLARYRALEAIDPSVLPPGEEDPSIPRTSPTFHVALDGSHKRHAVQLSASRTVGQAFGYGTVSPAYGGGLAYTYGPIHRFTFVASAGIDRTSRVPVGLPPNGYSFGARLEWLATERLGIVVGSNRWLRGGGEQVVENSPWNGYSVSLALAYSFAWR
jgi:hypothetical protein